jgi:hypothetical protein
MDRTSVPPALVDRARKSSSTRPRAGVVFVFRTAGTRKDLIR